MRQHIFDEILTSYVDLVSALLRNACEFLFGHRIG